MGRAASRARSAISVASVWSPFRQRRRDGGGGDGGGAGVGDGGGGGAGGGEGGGEGAGDGGDEGGGGGAGGGFPRGNASMDVGRRRLSLDPDRDTYRDRVNTGLRANG